MKKFIYTIICLLPLMGIISCDAFLKEHSPDKIPTDQAINNDEEAAQFLYGAYTLAKAVVEGRDYMALTELPTDNIDLYSSDIHRRSLTALTFNASNRHISALWSKLYTLIEQCNFLLAALEQNPALTESSGNVMFAEAKLLRAWSYLILVQLWGEVPLVTIPVTNLKEDRVYPRKSSVESIYSQIVIDLTFAAENLDNYEPLVMEAKQNGIKYPMVFTKGAAKCLLGRTYLILKQYDNVLETLAWFGTSGDINSNYALCDKYHYLFDNRVINDPERKKEVLWEIESKAVAGMNNTWHREAAPSDRNNGMRGEKIGDHPSSGYQSHMPTYDFISTFDQQNDKRYYQNIRWLTRAPKSRPCIYKGYDWVTLDSNTGGPTMVMLRVSEAYLMIAEAYNELGNQDAAHEFVNIVRTRAGLPDLVDRTQEELREDILLERRKEFVLEGGYRLFDLRRTGRYREVMESYHTCQTQLMALPSSERVEKFWWPDPSDASKSAPKVQGDDNNIPFISANKLWQPRYDIYPIPSEELIANPNLEQHPLWK